MAMFDKKSALLMTAATAVGATAAQADPSFTGPYAGISYGFNAGEFQTGDSDYGTFNSSNASAFFGFNAQAGAIVYGAEAALTFGEVTTDDSDYSVNNLVDLKARVGTTFGNVLVYGVLGWSVGTSDEDGYDYAANGMNYGVGAEMAIGDNAFVGVEYLARNMSSTNYMDARPMSTISLRGGFRF